MKVLYFGDPLIGPDRQDFIDGIVDCSTSFFDALCSSDVSKYEFRSVTNELAADRMVDYSQNYIVPSKYFLHKYDISNRYELLGKWFSGQYDESLLNNFAEFYKILLKDYEPDVIFTLSPVPYLQKIFPNALILHHEASMFTRYPFELSLFLDPNGLFQNAFYEKYAAEINNLQLNEHEKNLVDQLKYYYKLLLMIDNPYKNIMAELRKSFEKIILLPFQVSQYFHYDPRIEEKDPILFLKKFMSETDPAIGVIVTFHPSENILGGKELQSLQQEYRNLIYSNEIQNEKAPSNYLIPFVDGVGCVSSKVGLQTCLLDNKLLALGECYHGIADAINVADIPGMFEKEITDTDSLIYWMAVKYAVNSKFIFSKEWLPSFVDKSLEMHRNNSIDFHFYDDIENPENQLRDLIRQIKRYLPSGTNSNAEDKEPDSLNEYYQDGRFANIAKSLNLRRDSILAYSQNKLQKSIQKAEVEIEKNNLTEAEEILNAVLVENENNIDAMNDLAVINIMQNNSEKAVEYLSRILALDKDNPVAKENMEYLLNKIRMDENALAESVSSAGSLASSYLNNLREQDQNQNSGITMETYKTEQGDNFSIDSRIKDAENLIRSEQIEPAKEVLQSLLEDLPENVDVLNNLSVIAIMENQYDEARDLFSKIFEIDQDNEIALNNMAILQQRLVSVNSFLVNQASESTEKQSINEEDLFEDIACPFCGEWEAVTYRDAADIVKCKGCDLVYLRHRYKKEVMYQLYQSYADDGSHMSLPADESEIKSAVLRRDYWMDEILEFTKPEGTLLDIGCGWGAFLDNARDRGFTPRGIEMTKKCVSFTNETLGIVSTNEQFEDTPFEPKSINVVSMNHVFEHLPYPFEALKKIYNVLDDDGLFCGIVPNVSSYVSQNLKDEWYWLDPNYHYVHYSPATLRAHLEKNGFTIERLYTKTGDYGRENVIKVIKQKLSEVNEHEANKWLDQLEINEMGEEIRFIARKNNKLKK